MNTALVEVSAKVAGLERLSSVCVLRPHGVWPSKLHIDMSGVRSHLLSIRDTSDKKLL